VGTSEIAGHPARDARFLKEFRQCIRAREGLAVVFAQDDQAMGGVADDARGDPVQANEAEATEDTVLPHHRRDLFLVAQAVLEAKKQGMRGSDRRQKAGQFVVRGRLECDQHQVRRADVGRGLVSVGPNDEIAIRAEDP
jgi:hypothetical protein